MSHLEDTLDTELIESEYQKLFINIAYTAQHIESYMAKYLKKHDLTIPQYNVLRILKLQDGQPIKAVDLQKRMVHKTSNISRILDKLEEKNLAKRVDCDDNLRIRHVFIKPKGNTVLKEVEYILNNLYIAMDKNLKKHQVSPQFISDILEDFRKTKATND